MHGTSLVGVVAHRSVIKVFLNEQDLRPAAFESHNARLAKLAAVQPDVIRTDPRGKSALVEKLRIPLVDLQPQLPLLGIPVETKIARKLQRTGSLLRNRRSLRGIGRSADSLCQQADRKSQQEPAREFQHFQNLQRYRTVLPHIRLPQKKFLSAILNLPRAAES